MSSGLGCHGRLHPTHSDQDSIFSLGEHGHTVCHPHADCHIHINAYGGADRHIHANAYGSADRHTRAYAHGNADRDAHTYAYANAHSHAKGNAETGTRRARRRYLEAQHAKLDGGKTPG